VNVPTAESACNGNIHPNYVGQRYIDATNTFGGIVVEPKDENGVPLPNQTDWIFDRDPETEGIQEVKLWEALAGYADTFSDTTGDGVPDIVGYTEGEVRIIGFD
jgi:hypothetical protein